MIRALAGLLCLAVAGAAAVRGIDITERAAAGNGYETIAGRVRFGADPKLAANKIVRDLEYAPVDSQGEVEFSADFYILRPVDPAKSNGTALFEVSNRGGKGLMSRFNYATQTDPGDRWLLNEGFTLVWLGWEYDLPASTTLLHFTAPHFRPDAPTDGLVRSEFIPVHSVTSMPIADRTMDPVAVAKAIALYVRPSADVAPKSIAADRWHLGPQGRTVEMPSGFESGMLYEFVYQGKDPVVAGTGLAAIRDWISFLKYGGVGSPLGDTSRWARRAVGFGISQSGRFLREFLYDGFNSDEKGRMVFDGVWADVAGAGRGSFNFRYAQPSRDGHPFLNILYPTDVFPFVDSALLERARAAKSSPRLFLTNNSYEYWGRAAALIHVTPDGKSDASLLPDTRCYFIAGVQHGPRSLPMSKAGARYSLNPVDHRPIQRALLAAMQSWLKDGVEPPPSTVPRLARGELTGLDALKFPAIEGVAVPQHPRLARKLDFGPDFEKRGIITKEPPDTNGAFPVLVPQVDADGIDLGGIRLPELAVPLATITGWNFREPGRGAPDEMSEFNGSIFPFAKTKAEREQKGDRRLSLGERYPSREDYMKRVEAAADKLIAARFVLPRDRDFIVTRAGRLWDALAN
jgi:Alpha/beta hydrolase domain